MANAFRDPLDEEADAAEGAEGHSKNLRDRLAAVPAQETDEVEVQEPDEDDDEKEELAEAKTSRRDKRAARQSSRERAAAAEARAQVLQEQLEIARRSSTERQEPKAPAGNPVASIDARIKAANEALGAVHDEWNRNAGKLSKAREQELRDKAEALDIEKMTLVVQRSEALAAPQRMRESQAATLRARAPDVYANRAALDYAEGEFKKRLARGETDSLDTFDAAMQEAREVILGKRPKPDAAQRQRAAGFGGGPRASSAGDDAPKLAMTKGSPLYRLACAQYPSLDPKEACQKWANRNGKAYLARTRG